MSALKTDFTKKPNLPKLEEKVLDFWDQINAFEKSVNQRPKNKPYVFYDGPPFATGLPHYGHLLGSIMKDIIPRYWTMKGYRVERVWGWDCHGLPIENIVEKELSFKGGKKSIEDYGIEKFNQACRAAIFKFDQEWEKIIRRIARWVDFKNSYKTMDTDFMESVWWAFKTLHRKNLVYQGRKVILFCPRCSTPLSNFEIAMDNSYQEVKDYSIIVKFPIKGKTNEYLLAWTTTPWTLIGNVALAVKPDADYIKVKKGNEFYYIAKARHEVIGKDFCIIKQIKGRDLEGIKYQPLFNYLDAGNKKAFYVATADFISLEEGTGIVHTAAIYGQDDYQLATKLDLPLIPMLDDQGKYLDFVTPLAGQFYKKTEDWIINNLKKRSLIYHAGKLAHSVAFCYRCQTQLFYNAVPAWFINIQKLKKALIKNNQSINWYPSHLKNGRFGKGLKTAPDWNISRSRYWGTPMPVWVGDKTGKIRIIGSIKQLQQWAVDSNQVKNITDIHREHVDNIKIWVDDNKTEKGSRIPEVFDCWIESGSMSFGAKHYPFENKQAFKDRFPAQYIVEYVAQTRAWFYTLHVMATAIFNKPAFQNALTTGTIMAEDGSKMSKSKRNFPDPLQVINHYGVDSLRLYFASSPVMKTAQNVNFNQEAIDEIRKKVLNIFWNVYAFYKLYDDGKKNFTMPKNPQHVLDKWLISKIETLTITTTKAMDHYDVVNSSRTLMEFVDDISTWWLRLSRDRLKDTSTNTDPLHVFRAVIMRWLLLMAPFAPFFTETLYQDLTNARKKQSIHLEDFPTANKSLIHSQLNANMNEAQQATKEAHRQRKTLNLKLRQPLSQATITSTHKPPKQNLIDVLAQEINVKKIVWRQSEKLTVKLDTVLTPELKKEGQARELVRLVQQERKKTGVKLDQQIDLTLPDWPQDFTEYIKKKTLSKTISQGKSLRVKALRLATK